MKMKKIGPILGGRVSLVPPPPPPLDPPKEYRGSLRLSWIHQCFLLHVRTAEILTCERNEDCHPEAGQGDMCCLKIGYDK